MIISGNWKMNLDMNEAKSLAAEVATITAHERVGVVICPPAVFLPAAVEAAEGSAVRVGAQNMHFASEGAYTGELSASMLNSVGVEYVILGHSERRQYFSETDDLVHQKTRAALEAGLIPIVCVGEMLEERERGLHRVVVRRQVQSALRDLQISDPSELVVAYEPVWAIGTGKTATPDQAQEMHEFIKSILSREFGEIGDQIEILYGGSMKPANAFDLLSKPDVNGGLIGGASLRSDLFGEIIHAAGRVVSTG